MDTTHSGNTAPERSLAGKWFLAGLLSAAGTFTAMVIGIVTYDPSSLIGGDAFMLTMAAAALTAAVTAICWLVAGLCALVGAFRR